MPGLISHFLCGATVKEKLDSSISQNIIKYQQIFNIGTQGPDIFFYYLPYIIKKIDNPGSIMHRNNVGKFMQCMIEKANNLKHEARIKAFVYIAGYITHYNLDAYAHPYIYYKTGTNKTDKKSAIKHSVYHRRFETAVDTSLLKLLKNEKPSSHNLYKHIKANKNDIKLIGDILNYCIYHTYGIKLNKNESQKAINYMWRTTMLLQSKTGKRKKLLGVFEQKLIGQQLAASIIHENDINSKIDYLNLSKQPWFMPWDNKNERRESFTDLFFLAADDSINMINLLFQFMDSNIDIKKLVSAIGKRSFLSGLDDDVNVEFNHFGVVY